MSDKLFEAFKIKKLVLNNRFVMSAAANKLGNNARAQIERFAELAEGGVGLIISGGIRLPEIEKWSNIAEVIHKRNGRVALQIITEKGPGIYPWFDSDKEQVAVSVLPAENVYFHSFIKYGKHHAATDGELEKIINTYVKAAVKARKVGVDAIQIHAAHNSFLSQFLSPITNKRTDQWGGSIENRTKIHREIIKAIRAEIGDGFPVLIKLGVQDAFEEGLKFTEGKIAAQIIAECEYDALEISQGLVNFNDWNGRPMRMGINNISDEAYFRSWCREIKKSIQKPTIMTGGLRTYELMDEIVENNETDLVGLCRPLIREPNLINRWKEGDHRKATCVSCNKCITELLMKGKQLECYLDKKL